MPDRLVLLRAFLRRGSLRSLLTTSLTRKTTPLGPPLLESAHRKLLYADDIPRKGAVIRQDLVLSKAATASSSASLISWLNLFCHSSSYLISISLSCLSSRAEGSWVLC